MKGQKLFLHVVLTVLATAAALFVWLRDKEPKALAQGDYTVWTGRKADIDQVEYESKKKKVSLRPKQDEVGRYYVVDVDKETPAPPRKADAGADEPAEAEAPPRTQLSVVSVGAADKLLDQLAPLKALRAVGRIEGDRLEEFGLTQPEGTLTVRVGGQDRKLTIGGTTFGGGDRYVRFEGNLELYVIKGDIVRDLDAAESKLLERELHEWKDADVGTATVSAGGKTRELVRGGTEGKRFWADAASPDQNDETVSNWMTKFDRLRPSEYVVTPPESKETVVRIDYKDKVKGIGFAELIKAKGEGDKPTYYVVTERTRVLGKVVSSTAEQVEQDLGSVLK